MRCVVVDDEFPSREEIKYFIKKQSSLEIVDEFDDPLKALDFLQEEDIDVVFLDINMPNLNGMSLGKILSKFQRKPKIIFITAYDSYAVEAFGINAFDYILKPYSEDRIKETLKRLCEEETTKEESKEIFKGKITSWKGDKICVLSLDEISYFEACERETKVFVGEEVYIAKLKISKLEERLPRDKFFRTHRSFVVNLDKISEVIPWFNTTFNLKLIGVEERIPVSRSKIKEFKKIIGIN